MANKRRRSNIRWAATLAASVGLGCQGSEEAKPPESELDPGTCGIVSQRELPAHDAVEESVLGVPGGFVVIPEIWPAVPEALDWYALSDEDGEQMAFQSARPDRRVRALLPLGDPFDGRAVAVSVDQRVVSAQAVVSGAEPGTLHELGMAFERGTEELAAAI